MTRHKNPKHKISREEKKRIKVADSWLQWWYKKHGKIYFPKSLTDTELKTRILKTLYGEL